jgi:hypothetical protein
VTAPSAAETSFEEIARLIAPSAGAPPWLPTYLRNWAPSLLIDRHVHAMQPKKSKMKRRMKERSSLQKLGHICMGIILPLATSGPPRPPRRYGNRWAERRAAGVRTR